MTESLDGSADKKLHTMVSCKRCNGNGVIVDHLTQPYEEIICDVCNGTGVRVCID